MWWLPYGILAVVLLAFVAHLVSRYRMEERDERDEEE
jgi:hypothetical protein